MRYLKSACAIRSAKGPSVPEGHWRVFRPITYALSSITSADQQIVAPFLLVKVFFRGLYFHLPHVPFILLLPISPNLLELLFLMVLSMATFCQSSPWCLQLFLFQATSRLFRFCQLTPPPSNNSSAWFMSNYPTCLLWFCQSAPPSSNNSSAWFLSNYPTCLLWFCQLAPPPRTPFNSIQLM